MQTTNERPAALVTGASSGIGQAICRVLLDEGYEVYGIGRRLPKAPVHPAFHPIAMDLTDLGPLTALREQMVPKHQLKLLVHSAGVAYYGPHETISPKQLAEMTAVNLTAPLILTQLFLRDLKETSGMVVFVSSVTARSTNNTFGCAYGATKAALTSFATSLFEECRKSGLRVLTLAPDLTETNLYRHADFTPGNTPDTRLLPEEVADALRYALTLREDINITELTLRPQRNRILKKLPDQKQS